jgi:type I restriction enzyme M protein
MDDMDKDAQGLGGKSSFFTNGYEKYAWSHILDPRLGGQERLNRYAEALATMSQNPHLPQLFRTIFKDAFLPYRDPTTLNLFLKEIDGFTYDHSENLGDAYEYLLSILGSQGDAGQFRTPRHIIDFMVRVVDPKKNETMLDPASGTAGFLISSYRHIIEQNRGHQLTPDEKERLAGNLQGYDIAPDMVRIGLVNMYLHSFPNPHIYEYDTLTSEDRWDEQFDICMANPPFMTPKGGIRPHKKFQIQANRSEVLFVDYIAEHLKPTGRAAVIVPEGIIFTSDNAYKNLRKMLVETWGLWAVVSLPSGVFNPYSNTKTCILFLEKAFAKTTDEILFAKVQNDGFDLGAQRRPIDKNDLPQARAVLQAWHSGTKQENSIANWVNRKKIAESGGYNLTGERYKEIVTVNAKWPMAKLQDICEINPKKAEVSSLERSMAVSFIPMEDIGERERYITPKRERTLGEVYKGYTYFRNGDVLVAKVTPCFENGKSGIVAGLINGIGFGSSELHVIRPSEQILAGYVYPFVASQTFIQRAIPQMTGTGGLQRVPASFLQKLQVPLPPLDVQQQIVDELDGYQRIVDGAKQVIANWRPTFDIDPSWPLLPLKKVCGFDLQQVQPNSSGASALPYLGMDDIESGTGTILQWQLDSTVRSNTFAFDHRHILYGKLRPYLNKVALPDRPGRCSTELVPILPNETVDRTYLAWFLRMPQTVDVIMKGITGSRMPRADLDSLMKLPVPLPSMDVQRSIVAAISEEEQVVESCKGLVSTYEAKISATVAHLWNDKSQDK